MSQSQSSKPSPSRRTFIKGVTIGTGAIATGGVGLRFSSGTSRAALPAVPFGIAAGGAGIGYLMKTAYDVLLGDSRDYSGYTGEDALHQELVTGALEVQSTDERVTTSISNNITNSENVALAKGKAAMLEAMNAEEEQSEATAQLQDAIDDYYSIIQENIVNHWNAHVEQIAHMMEQVEAHENLIFGEVFNQADYGYWYSDELQSFDEVLSHELTLKNGKDIVYKTLEVSGDGIDHYSFDFRTDDEGNLVYGEGSNVVRFGVIDPDDAEEQFALNDAETLENLWDEITAKRDDVNAQLSGFTADVYEAYEPGEIPTEDLVDPITAATELNQDYDGYQVQGAYASMLGIPTSAEQSLYLTIHTDEGDEGVYADIYTQHVPTDSEDEEVGFETGETYDPTTWDEPLYIAYEWTYEDDNDEVVTESDFVQLETEFTIEEATDAEGNDIESFQVESRNTQTSDVETLEEELAQIREEQLRLLEEFQDGGGGGGGGFLPDDVSGRTLAIVAAALVGLGILSNN